LIVAVQGPLASLPFSALVVTEPEPGKAPEWLIQRMAITQVPTSSSLLALRRAAAGAVAPRPLIGFGDPVFDLAGRNTSASPIRRVATSQVATAPAKAAAAKQSAKRKGILVSRTSTSFDIERGFRYADIPGLPETRTELLALAAALGADPQQDLYLGERASRNAVLQTDLSDRRVVAFATHGLMPGEIPGVSKPSLAMSAVASNPTGQSPLLTLDDVLALRLNAQWVVLSACNTAAGEMDGSAMSGLVRGFFFAGARSVLATHWSVESASAEALVSSTFKRAADDPGRSRATSLREAQLAMINGQLGNGKWRHPFYWAPYSLFGDPSR
jgi:CHAT domain-containing protein